MMTFWRAVGGVRGGVLGVVMMGVMMGGCVPLLLAAVTVTAVDVATDRRTPGRYLDDNRLEVLLREDFAKDAMLGEGINISVTSMNGVVLLSGEVNNDEQRQRAGRLVGGREETRTVVNELELAGKTNISSRVNDTWITSKVKAGLLNTPNLEAATIKVVTEHGKVYLLGLVTEAEAEAAVKAAGEVNGVTHIVKVFEYIE